MSKLILQPCADKLAMVHFEETVEGEIDLKRIKKILKDRRVVAQLERLYPTGKCKVWGVVPRNGRNAKKWEKIDPGDKVFFAKHKSIFASGVVTMKVHSKRLAIELWKRDKEKNTWEYIYFLDKVADENITYAAFNAAMGYRPNSNIQSFQVLDEGKSLLALEELGLENDSFSYLSSTEQSLEQKRKRLRALAGSTNRKYLANGRTEQELLQEILFAGKQSEVCGICQKSYPVSLMVVAHIKKRAFCSEEERVNEKIVMPMCKMGCDDLYEKGFISIQGGKVVELSKRRTEPVEDYILALKDKKCKYYNEETDAFFQWHYDHHVKTPVVKKGKRNRKSTL